MTRRAATPPTSCGVTRRLRMLVPALVGVIAVVASCGSSGTGDDFSDAPDDAASLEPAQWGYEGEIGPDNWGDLSDAYLLCGQGEEQSPIELADPVVGQSVGVAFDYVSSPLRIVDNGHTIQNNIDGDSAITIDGREFELIQFHQHAPSEHRMDDEYPLEIHFVHIHPPTGQLAVVAVFGGVGDANAALESIVANLPDRVDAEVRPVGETIDPAALLPSDSEIIRYPGSLTVPPCVEDVMWNVLTTPIEVSRAQLDAYTGANAGNSRPIQELNDRQPTIDRLADIGNG